VWGVAALIVNNYFRSYCPKASVYVFQLIDVEGKGVWAAAGVNLKILNLKNLKIVNV
jgi:hypothetical protein